MPTTRYPSVKDALVLQTLSDALWAEIRTKAPTKKSFYAPGDHQFSKVIKGHSSEYGSLNAWLAFQETIFGLNDWPGLRQATLAWWQSSRNPETKLGLLSKLFSSGDLVDDAAKMDATLALVSARLPKTKFVNDQISEILSTLDQIKPWDFYSKVLLLSKYGTDDGLIRLIEATVSLWITQEHLSRLVAGVFPRFIGSAHRPKFEAIIRRTGSPWSMGVLQFHLDLIGGTKGYTAIQNFVLAKNSSLPNSISHSKFMILLSLSNPDIAPTAVANLKKVHSWALSDPYYSSL